jgi:hypothetical protein
MTAGPITCSECLHHGPRPSNRPELHSTQFCQYIIREGIPIEKAKRDPVKYRYDVLYWNFLHAMAEIGHFGAEKYGDFNYQQPGGLKRDKSPVNHIANHLRRFIEKEPYDHSEVGDNRKYHLAAIAFNAMMEFYHLEHPDASTSKKDQV